MKFEISKERASKNIATNICPMCNKPYENGDVIILNQIAKKKMEEMRENMESKRRINREGSKL